MSKEKRLGRGLAALLGTPLEEEQDLAPREPPAPAIVEFDNHAPPAGPQEPAAEPVAGDLIYLDVYEIDDNPFQPRRDFSEAEIHSLAESLKEHDMLQPLLVRRIEGRYQLISGERRLRAAIQAGWKKVPVRIREADDRLVAELAIVENLQRKDLNPVEKALSFKRYIDQHQCTQDFLAQRLTLDRSTIANSMRLLELPPSVLEALQTGEISAGHARTLLPLGDEPLQVDFCRQIQQDGWSVRETERRVADKIREMDGEGQEMAGVRRRRRTKNQQIASLEQELKRALGARVDIRQSSSQRGKIVIHFMNHDEFERIRDYLNGNEREQKNVG